MRQIREAQTSQQVRGPARAVMCETRALGIKCSNGTLFCQEIKKNMMFVCPKDVKNNPGAEGPFS